MNSQHLKTNKKTWYSSIIWCSIPAIIIFTIIYINRMPNYLDDAYIFYRYAVNWASGHGPVYNIGEYVEGYSSFLWTAILAAAAYLSFDPVDTAPLLSLLIGISSLILLSYICKLIQFSSPYLIALSLTLFYALSYGVIYYGTSGMDALLFSSILLLCIVSLYKSKNSGNYLVTLPFLMLLNIARTESPLYSTVLLAVLTYFVVKENKKIPTQLILTVLIFIAFTILLFGVRYQIYNELIPAPVLAKGFSSYHFKGGFFECLGWKRELFIKGLLDGIRYEIPLFYSGAWIPFFILVKRENKNDLLLWMLAFSVVINISVSIWAVGDFMPYKRHIIFILPMLLLLTAWAGDTLINRYWHNSLFKRIAISVISISVIVLWINFFIKPTFTSTKFVEKGRVLYHRQLGTLLKDLPFSTTVLTDMAGSLPYYAGSNVYVRDMVGLTDLHNAKYGEYFSPTFGRSDLNYSFSTPFDIFINNSWHINPKFYFFCQKNPSKCHNYRFYKKDEWNRSELFIFANIKHPISTALEKQFGAVPVIIDENLNKVFLKWMGR